MFPYSRSARFKLRWPDDAAFATSSRHSSFPAAAITAGGRISPTAAVLPASSYFSSDREGPFNIVGGFGSEPPRGFSFVDDALGPASFPRRSLRSSRAASTSAMQRTGSLATTDLSIWPKIRRSTDALLFKNYFDFMDWVFCNDPLSAQQSDQ